MCLNRFDCIFSDSKCLWFEVGIPRSHSESNLERDMSSKDNTDAAGLYKALSKARLHLVR